MPLAIWLHNAETLSDREQSNVAPGVIVIRINRHLYWFDVLVNYHINENHASWRPICASLFRELTPQKGQ